MPQWIEHKEVKLFSLMFERAHGWTGLLVEPHPLIFAKVTRPHSVDKDGAIDTNTNTNTNRNIENRQKHRQKHRKRLRQGQKQPGGNLKQTKTYFLRGCRCKGKHGVLRLVLQPRISRFPGEVYTICRCQVYFQFSGLTLQSFRRSP